MRVVWRPIGRRAFTSLRQEGPWQAYLRERTNTFLVRLLARSENHHVTVTRTPSGIPAS
jgi:hypothetical protein